MFPSEQGYIYLGTYAYNVWKNVFQTLRCCVKVKFLFGGLSSIYSSCRLEKKIYPVYSGDVFLYSHKLFARIFFAFPQRNYLPITQPWVYLDYVRKRTKHEKYQAIYIAVISSSLVFTFFLRYRKLPACHCQSTVSSTT